VSVYGEGVCVPRLNAADVPLLSIVLVSDALESTPFALAVSCSPCGVRAAAATSSFDAMLIDLWAGQTMRNATFRLLIEALAVFAVTGLTASSL